MATAVAKCKDEGIEIDFDEELLDELNITNGLWVGIKKIFHSSYRDHNDTEVGELLINDSRFISLKGPIPSILVVHFTS